MAYKRVTLGGEADILAGEGLSLSIRKRTSHRQRRSLTKFFPGSRAVNRFPIHLEPGTDLAQHLLFWLRNGAVCFGTNVEQQRAVLADDINQDRR